MGCLKLTCFPITSFSNKIQYQGVSFIGLYTHILALSPKLKFLVLNKTKAMIQKLYSKPKLLLVPKRTLLEAAEGHSSVSVKWPMLPCLTLTLAASFPGTALLFLVPEHMWGSIWTHIFRWSYAFFVSRTSVVGDSQWSLAPQPQTHPPGPKISLCGQQMKTEKEGRKGGREEMKRKEMGKK